MTNIEEFPFRTPFNIGRSIKDRKYRQYSPEAELFNTIVDLILQEIQRVTLDFNDYYAQKENEHREKRTRVKETLETLSH